MKISASLLALVAVTAVQDAAVAKAEPRSRLKGGFCGAPGASCAKAKRAAFAVAEAIAEPEDDPWFRGKRTRLKGGFCGARGASCARALEHINEIEAAAEHSYELAVRNTDPKAEAEPEAEARRRTHPEGGFCGARNASCAKPKHDASAEAEASTEADPWFREKRTRRKGGFCGARGASCARTVEATNEFDPEYLKKICYEEGNECDTILKAHSAYHEAVKREALAEADPGARRKSRLKGGFCGARGASCARDVQEYLQARDNNDPAAEEAETACHAEDGGCTVAERGHEELGAAIDRAIEILATM